MYTVPAVEQKDPGWRFVGLWILTYIVGSGFGFFIAAPLMLLMTLPAAQWWVIKRYIPNAGWWIAATAVGELGVLSLSFLSILVETPGSLLSSAIIGLSFGIPQFLVLRRSIPQAGWWIPNQLLALLASSFVAALISEAFISLIGFMVVYTLSTSLGLRWLLAATPQSHRQIRWLSAGLVGICALLAIAT